MIENGSYYDFSNEQFIPAMEFWKPITNKSVPNVKPFYWISDLGRAFNTNTNRFIPQFDDAKRGYLLITLATDNGNITKSVHRIVMIEFVGFDPDPKKNEVDHISGIKYNNSIYNLRWVSGSENITAAYDNGLMPSGEDSPMSILSNDDVRNICQMMQDNVDRHVIYDFIMSKGVSSPSSVFYSIYNRVTWKRISNEYTFANYKERSKVFSDPEIHQICKGLEMNLNHRDIIISLGIDPNMLSRAELDNMYTFISHVKKGLHYTEISSLYNIDRNSTKKTFTDSEVHYICRRIKDGIRNIQILYELGYHIDVSKNRSEYFKYSNGIMNIRNKRSYTHISSQYF